MTKKITEIKSLTYEEALQEDWLKRFTDHMLEVEKRLWIPVIETNQVFQKLKYKDTEMKTVKVIPAQDEQIIYSNAATREQCYFFDAINGCIGIALLTAAQTTECFVRWANGNNSPTYSNFSNLVKNVTRGNPITVHQII